MFHSHRVTKHQSAAGGKFSPRTCVYNDNLDSTTESSFESYWESELVSEIMDEKITIKSKIAPRRTSQNDKRE